MIWNNNTTCCGGRPFGDMNLFNNDFRDVLGVSDLGDLRDFDFRRNDIRLDCFCRCDPFTNTCLCRCDRVRDCNRNRNFDCFCRCDNRFNNCLCSCERDRDRFDRF